MKTLNRFYSNQVGVTLIELVVVVAIVGILSAIAIPAYFSKRPQYDLNRAVRDYYSLLQKAKMTAIKDRGNCSISFTATGYTAICDDRDTSTCQATSSCSLSVSTDLSKYNTAVQFGTPDATAPFPAGTVTFNSTGEAGTGYLYFTHARNNEFYRVGPLISGVINLHHWESGDWK